MWSPEQQTTQLAYKAGFDPTPKVEPFFAGMHTVSRRRPHPWLQRVDCKPFADRVSRVSLAAGCPVRRTGFCMPAGRCVEGAPPAIAHGRGSRTSAETHCIVAALGHCAVVVQSSNPAASPHTLGAGFIRGHPIFTSMILPHNIVYHPTNHPKENWYVSVAIVSACLRVLAVFVIGARSRTASAVHSRRLEASDSGTGQQSSAQHALKRAELPVMLCCRCVL